jgi:alpha,alpha-trehalose-phosphate synthase [UDP-forming]
MKITLRLIVSLVLAAALVASVFSYVQVQDERDRLTRELDVRASILAESLQESVKELLRANSPSKLKRLADRFGNRDRLVGVAVYDSQAVCLAASPGLLIASASAAPSVWEAIARDQSVSVSIADSGQQKHVYVTPLHLEGKQIGALVVLHDASYIETRMQGIWQTNFVRVLMHSLLIILVTAVVVRFTLTGPISQVATWMRNLRTGKPAKALALPRGDILGPLTAEVTLLAKSLAVARATAEEEARLRVEAGSLWTAERLKEHVRQELGSKNLIVVSNREPYMHVRQSGSIECIMPAGGLVTALDPILQACGGVWIAHGSGDADREMSDAKGRLSVPPEDPRYTLRRIAISKEEEEGYYYGFSNEGIWPLCHITHTRPLFRLNDWVSYQKVNEKFAEAILEEIHNEAEPLVLVQDYHFALLPLLIKSKRPDARVAIFWHIPWPNPEVFGICPWKQEILLGLLGADLIGFHIQFHCNNFLETVDRYLESKINWDQFTIERKGESTAVRPFPISVAFPELAIPGAEQATAAPTAREVVAKMIGHVPKYLAVGVDRIDYTKGIAERLWGVERFLEKYPEYVGQFTFVELGAPSRTHIKRYHDLMAEVEETVDKINWRFRMKDWKPIVFLKAHHGHQTINPFYRVAQLCMVTSLHDGMNLVAKEFVATRDDEDGVLILSQFTGASRELQDAIIVNPYDVEELADAIHTALTMQRKERHERMHHMREVIRDRNVYRWAGNIISTLSRLRLPRQAGEGVLPRP